MRMSGPSVEVLLRVGMDLRRRESESREGMSGWVGRRSSQRSHDGRWILSRRRPRELLVRSDARRPGRRVAWDGIPGHLGVPLVTGSRHHLLPRIQVGIVVRRGNVLVPGKRRKRRMGRKRRMRRRRIVRVTECCLV